ncbi:biogenesis of lysosome-related organelles complex 1 subunit 1-like protein [Rhizopus microsporus var. microsporus]|uniref:Biogenesis of lysosome-related organelles complex 1 subunit 1 n=2 Tax=Rhizopus microsporus TaxID=58291 RepID=A0A2G4SIN1_RHIZD|nr:biogenesis of lysosome-related organelles complex 1 subunit 1-like protein [Rhizopus microsporus ATCC 52813]ORE08192.1 biogenesis of lysosome-related organelles complex 1 subunit 1-like protein [Rhizopus microsporus var. microsporus]PHZ08637.1 biogenesis of lysosome-related organelles complex 1 subunit 1-like protein [Rhizopus microsporus ATCC 52813]
MSDLTLLLKNHNQKKAEIKRNNEQIRKNAVQATNELTDSITDYVNEEVSDIFAKQKELEQQSKRLATQVTKYINQTQQWLSLVDNFNHSLKELGDVKNWAQIMEHDMKTVMTTLEFVHQGNNNNIIS